MVKKIIIFLTKHNNKYHDNTSQHMVNIKSTNSQQKVNIILTNEKKFQCIYCNKFYSFKQLKWVHEQKCGSQSDPSGRLHGHKIKYDEINNYKLKISELETEIKINKNNNKTINKTINNIITNQPL